jgi:bifunctional non-homologous end joining protein LigD
MKLTTYRTKRHFQRTPEPKGTSTSSHASRFVVQKHDASRLHYDFRLELDGVLKSWAVPKGPNLDPNVKTLAVHVEDHPVEYASFEGTIPEGEYGAGAVLVWDQGTWNPEGDGPRDYHRGDLTFQLHGERLKGRWKLVKMHGRAGANGKNWLLMKLRDEYAGKSSAAPIVSRASTSVVTGRTLEEVAGTAEQPGLSTPKRSKRRRERAGAKTGAGDPGAGLPRDEIRSKKGARRGRMPAMIKPQLATLVRDAPQGDEWVFELKFDGYRLICRKEHEHVVLRTRAGHDWTHRFPSIAQAVAGLPARTAMLDGEVVVMARDGTTDFQALQNLMQRASDEDAIYYAFDLVYCDGFDLTSVPLADRKALLERLVKPSAGPESPIRYSDHLRGPGPVVFAHACRSAVEGMVAKRADAGYEQRRSTSWLKLKCLKRQEFVIGGWTDPGGTRAGLGSLLLGYYRQPGELTYCGRVGTGFTDQTLAELRERLDEIAAGKPPFVDPPGGRPGQIHWVLPRLVAEISFGSWTNDGILRHSVFHGLRDDKQPEEVIREMPRQTGFHDSARNRKAARSANVSTGLRLTHPDRVLYPESKITKRDLAEYYAAIADWILPHLEGRPLAIVRCPEGRRGECFFQRHMSPGMPSSLRAIEVQEQDRRERCPVVDDAAGLWGLAQIGALEIHPWGSREDRLDRPDRLILDLDPGEGVAWSQVVGAAHEVRDRLGELELTSFVRTTGGKGLHVVLPIRRTLEWDALKSFARQFAEALRRDFPQRFVAQASKAQRAGKIYVDYLRNDRAATAIASYSTRAREGAPVATPVAWQELTEHVDPRAFNLRTTPGRLARQSQDPWDGFFDLRQTITTKQLEEVSR